MFRKIGLALLFTATATPALAEHCSAPYAPDVAAVTSATTERQMSQLRDDVQSFISASDIYQSCLVRAAASADERGKAEINTQIDSNQREKVRVGTAFNTAVAQLQKRTASN